MIANGENPYPHKFQVDLSLPAYIEKFRGIPDGDRLDTTVSIAGMARSALRVGVQTNAWTDETTYGSACVLCSTGRVMSKRAQGKLVFYDLHGEGVHVQILADAKYGSRPCATGTRTRPRADPKTASRGLAASPQGVDPGL